MAGLTKQSLNGRKAYVVGAEVFARKEDVADRCRQIVARTGVGVALNATDRAFVLALASFHRNAAVKIGVGVASVTVRRNPKYPATAGFWLTRVDGSQTDISWVECVTKTPHARCVAAAFRAEVDGQVAAFRRHAYQGEAWLVCPVSGAPVYPDEAHVDHAPPMTFETLVGRFLTSRGLTADDVKLEYFDGDAGDRIMDRELATAWAEYHRDHAELRIVSKAANLGTIKRQANAAKRAPNASASRP